MDGAALQYVYCVSLFTTVYVSNPYAQTSVNKAGIIYDLNGPGTGPAMVPNAGQVAWLLTTYGTAGQGPQAVALQAAIWNVINTDSVYQLDTAWYTAHDPNVATLYNAMLAASLGQTGTLSDFLWITPGIDSNGYLVNYQGLIAPIPIPAAAWLLGSGLVGLVAIRRRMKK